MNPSSTSSTPACIRAINLVRQHHGLPSCLDTKDEEKENRRKPNWAAEAKEKELHAKCRVINLDEIPPSQYPVVLEVKNGTNYVILTERRDAETFSIQFLDSRESDVSKERLEEFYDGRCVFFKPAGSQGGGGSVFKRMLDAIGNVRFSKGAFGFNLVVLLVAVLLVYSNEKALGKLIHRSLFLPVFATAVAAFALAGVIGLRHEFFRHRASSGWIDLAFVPIMFAAALGVAGWSVLPVMGLGGILLVCLLTSKRLGSVPSRLQSYWKGIVAMAFLVGAFSLSLAYLDGLLNVAMMNGALGLSTYAIYLIAHGGSSWQSMRLAMCR
ncbi:MAG: hypothetical protein P1U68_17210 [Verrucomicrobiales bacterium]|nr:hypothetical protein [Verrucomicrobiales bacterium]